MLHYPPQILLLGSNPQVEGLHKEPCDQKREKTRDRRTKEGIKQKSNRVDRSPIVVGGGGGGGEEGRDRERGERNKRGTRRGLKCEEFEERLGLMVSLLCN